MKEKIYTIPVMDGFKADCECPLCLMEAALEEKMTGYFVNGAHMEVDGRQETNELGFCRAHFTRIFSSQKNTLGLGLILDTYMQKYNEEFLHACQPLIAELENGASKEGLKNKLDGLTGNKKSINEGINKVSAYIDKRDGQCAVCTRVDNTVDDYIRTILYLWEKEEDFRQLFLSKKGFCMKHLKRLLEGSTKYLSKKKLTDFCLKLLIMQQENLSRIQQEVNWFTLKADYRNEDKPWGNSKDAVQRGIAKLKGKSG